MPLSIFQLFVDSLYSTLFPIVPRGGNHLRFDGLVLYFIFCDIETSYTPIMILVYLNSTTVRFPVGVFNCMLNWEVIHFTLTFTRSYYICFIIVNFNEYFIGIVLLHLRIVDCVSVCVCCQRSVDAKTEASVIPYFIFYLHKPDGEIVYWHICII